MARDANGNYSRIHNWVTDRINSVKVLASRMDAEDDSIATALTNSLDRSSGGGGNILRNVDLSTHKFTSVAPGTALTDSVNLDQIQSGVITYFGQTTGTSTVYVLTPSPSINAYDTGMTFWFQVNVASGASPTLNISSKGAKSLKWWNYYDGTKTPILSDDLETGVFYQGLYDGTDILILNFSQVISSTPSSRSIISIGTDTDHDINISAGFSVLNDDTQAILTSSLTKQIDSNWAVGTGNGGFPSGLVLAINTWYRVFIIYNPTTGAVDAGFDTDDSATNLLADATGYTKYSHRGWILTDASSNILPINVDYDHFFNWDVGGGYRDVSTSPTTSAATHTLAHIPKNCRARLQVKYRVATGGGNHFGLLTEIRQTDETPTSSLFNLESNDNTTFAAYSITEMDLLVSSTSTVRSRFDSTSGTFTIFSQGWKDLEIK